MADEVWKCIPEYPGYEASSEGRVRNVRRGRVLVGTVTKKGYRQYSLRGARGRRVALGHRLVAAAFLGPAPAPPGNLVNHLDTNKLNNIPGNLEYTTPQGNARHAAAHGLIRPVRLRRGAEPERQAHRAAGARDEGAAPPGYVHRGPRAAIRRDRPRGPSHRHPEGLEARRVISTRISHNKRPPNLVSFQNRVQPNPKEFVMALKGDRNIIETDISLTCESVAERGVTLVYRTAGSGTAIGASAGRADLVTNPSGQKVAGLLLNDVVDVDVTRYRLNPHKDERLVGQRCTLLRKGRVTTNKVVGFPTSGATAYLTIVGVLTSTRSAVGGEVATPKVGVFAGSRDEDGFVAVDIDLPIA